MEASINKKGNIYSLEYKNIDGKNIVVTSTDVNLLIELIKGKADNLIINYI